MSISPEQPKEVMSPLPFAPVEEDSLDNQTSINKHLTDIKEEIDQLRRQLNILKASYEQNGELQEQLDQSHIAANIQILERLIVFLRNQHDNATMSMLSGKHIFASINLLNVTLAESNLIASLAHTDLIDEIIKSQNNWQVGTGSIRLRASTIRLIIETHTDMGIEIPLDQVTKLLNFIN